MGSTKNPLKEKWSPGCAKNSDVVSCELRGKEQWSRYHAILQDGREIELRRVSNVLEMLETKALVQWAANETAYHLMSQFLYLLPAEVVAAAGLAPVKEFDGEHAGDLRALLRTRERNGIWTPEQFIDFAKAGAKMCEQSRFNNGRTRDVAKNWGTEAHAWIERFLKYNYWPDEDEQASMAPEVLNSLARFSDLWGEHDLEVIPGMVEVYVWDLDLGVGGTVDLVAIRRKRGGGWWVFDWKTGGLYKKGVLQMACYVGCLRKAGHKIDGAVLCQVGRTDGIPQFRELTLDQLRPAWNFFRDLALNYETDKDIGNMCTNWNKEHKDANERRAKANEAEEAGSPGGHLDRKELWRELSASVKKLDKRLHSVLTDTKMGEVDGTGCDLLLPLGFDWHMDELEKALPTLQQIAERKSGIAGFQVRLRYDG